MKGVFPMPSQVTILIAVAAVMFFVIGGLSLLAHYYTLSGIKSKTVGDGQHGTARFATENKTNGHTPMYPTSQRNGGVGRICPPCRGLWWAASKKLAQPLLSLMTATFTAS